MDRPVCHVSTAFLGIVQVPLLFVRGLVCRETFFWYEGILIAFLGLSPPRRVLLFHIEGCSEKKKRETLQRLVSP